MPFGFALSGGAGWEREGASDDALFRLQPAVSLFPNPALKPRTDFHLLAGADWESRWLGLGAAWNRHHFGDNWLPRTLPDARDSASIPDSLALPLDNYDEEIRDLLRLSLRLSLGRWNLALHHNYLVHGEISDSRGVPTDQNRTLPKRVYQGQLRWRRVVLGGKLGLQSQWDWDWFSARHVYASDLDGFSRVVKLDEYLVLDYSMRMEVKSFLLYFRARNLNHDRYATEPGVHPPGVNFRFGVDWRLWN
jgi:hypothetical protein